MTDYSEHEDRVSPLERAAACGDAKYVAQHVIDGIVNNNLGNDGAWSDWDDADHAIDAYLKFDRTVEISEEVRDEVREIVAATIAQATKGE
jgi:hypothetical protein